MRTVLILILFSTPLFAQALDDGCWLTGAPLPTPRQEMQQVLLNEKIFVIGGLVQGGIGTDLLEVYDPQNNTWSTSTPLPQKMHHISVAEVNGKIYVLGGFLNNTFQPTDVVYEFDPGSSTWTGKASMLKPRGAATATVVNGLIYVIGGVANPGGVTDANEVFDPVNNTWQSLASMPTSREHLASASIGSIIYVAGGSNNGNINKFEAYNTTTNSWTILPDLPTARSGLTACAYSNRIYVFGGEIQGVYDKNEFYDPSTNLWSEAAPMPTARHGIGSTLWNNAIYIIGGGPVEGYGVSNVNERFTMDPVPFSDDFADNDISDWLIVKGTWAAANGFLTGTNKRKGEIRSMNAGCSCCKTVAPLQIVTSGARASLLTHYLNKGNRVEVLIKEENDKWVVKHWKNGSVAAKSSAISTINTGQIYDVQIEYVNGELQLTVDGALLISVSTVPPEQGTIGFRIKSTTGTPASVAIDHITVN
jgi:N-acetylneuraminic acid mutarotase